MNRNLWIAKHRAATLELLRHSLPALMVLGAALYYLSYIRYGINFEDEGALLLAADAVLKGKVLYRDLYVAYMPGGYYLYALFFKCFGSGIVVGRMLCLTLRLLSVVLCLAIARRFLPSGLAVLPVVPMVLVPGPWYKTLFVTLSLLNVAVALWYCDGPTWKRLVVCGLLVGFTALYRHELGLACLGIMSVSILLDEVTASATQQRNAVVTLGVIVCRVVVLTAIAALVLVPVLAYLRAQGAFNYIFASMLTAAARYNLARHKELPAFRLSATGRERSILSILGYNVYALLYWFPLAIYLLTLVLTALRLRQRMQDRESRDGLVACMSGVILYGLVYLFPHPVNLLTTLPVAYLLAAWIAYRLFQRAQGVVHSVARWSGPAYTLLVGLCVIGGLLSLVCGWSSPYAVGSMALRWSCPAYLDLPRAGVYGQTAEVEDTKKVVEYVKAHTVAQDPLLVMPVHGWLLYFLCERFPPSKQPIEFALGERGYAEEQILAQDLAEHRPPYIIVWEGQRQNPALSAPDSVVMAFVNANYKEEARFGQYTILKLARDIQMYQP